MKPLVPQSLLGIAGFPVDAEGVEVWWRSIDETKQFAARVT
jgi:hypothetical protein